MTTRTDAAALIDQSIRHGIDSIKLQLDAKDAIGGTPTPPGGVVVVCPGDSLASVLEGLTGGETVIVSREVVTHGDLVLSKPVRLIGAAIIGRVDVQAPNVTLIGCSITGPDNNGALLATGPQLVVQSCRITGSATGQHRGIWVRSEDVTIADSAITNCWKQGQDVQAVAGWAGIKRLRIYRSLLEGSGECFILGGTDCAEADIPDDIIMADCTLRKPLEWRTMGVGAKNLFELKNCKHVLVERCTMEHSWVDGQSGYAVLFNVRNQEGTAPWSTIEDVVFRNNTITHMAAGINILGTDYTYPSQVLKRVTIEHNTFTDISPDWGNNQRCIFCAHGGEDIAFLGNTFEGRSINSFLTFEAKPVVRMVFQGNRVPEGSYGIKADDTTLGTPTLDKYAPGCTWDQNTVVRTIEQNIPYPPGTTVVAG